MGHHWSLPPPPPPLQLLLPPSAWILKQSPAVETSNPAQLPQSPEADHTPAMGLKPSQYPVFTNQLETAILAPGPRGSPGLPFWSACFTFLLRMLRVWLSGLETMDPFFSCGDPFPVTPSCPGPPSLLYPAEADVPC